MLDIINMEYHMKIKIKNLGVFKQAEFELGDLTIICGENNTGKTYATYSLFGFYDYWKSAFTIPIEETQINKLLNNGILTIPISRNIDALNKIIYGACGNYSSFLSKVFAGKEKYFERASFSLILEDSDINIRDEYSISLGSSKMEMIQILKERGKDEITINLLLDKKNFNSTSIKRNIKKAIGNFLKEIIFGKTFSGYFIASAERTGASIFKNELNIDRNAIIEAAGEGKTDISSLREKLYNPLYALPVRKNIDFIRDLENIAKTESIIYKKFPDILTDFADIIGGEYKVGRDGLCYIPKGNLRIKLTMGESSSSVRSLLDIGFYLRHIAQIGDLLIVDEPELNLHPNNQRRIARLFARLVGIGIKVFITTHSDYIVKEINTLIMFESRKLDDNIKKIMLHNKYCDCELINHEKVKVFISGKDKVQIDGHSRRISSQTLIPAKIDPEYGIEAECFDNAIREMNSIQESIILGRK